VDLKTFTSAIAQIAEEKGIPREKVIETIKMAIAAAYKKDYGVKGQIIRAKLNEESGEVKFSQLKIVVDESMLFSEKELEELKNKKISGQKEPLSKAGEEERVREKESEAAEERKNIGDREEKKFRFNPEKHMMLDEAKKIKPDVKVGEELEFHLETKADYGRIAAMTAKQVIIQRIREAEREAVFEEYKTKEGEVISGIVQRLEGRNIFFDIGKTVGLLPPSEQIPGEFYKIGSRLRLYILKVDKDIKGSIVILSRAYPKFLSKLFEIEVPEIASRVVIIKAIAREPGSRSKIAVKSEQPGIDPIGSMVGQKGTRVGVVIDELGGEKIDIIEWSESPEKFIANSLSPAKVLEVKVSKIRNQAIAIVPEEQLSLAIGRDGQNVRLAAKLTGWKIDVRMPEAVKKEKIVEKEEEVEVQEKEKEEEKKDIKKKAKVPVREKKEKIKKKPSEEAAKDEEKENSFPKEETPGDKE